jgi:hypothetical protein
MMCSSSYSVRADPVGATSASASSYVPLRTTRMPEEGIKAHRFAAVLPKQLLTEASRHRDAVVPADQRAVMRCLGDDLTGLVHDVSHSRIALSGSTSAIQRSTRGFHVCSYARDSAQPAKPCAERLRIAKHVMRPWQRAITSSITNVPTNPTRRAY